MKLVSSAEEEKAKGGEEKTENLAHTIPANSELVSREWGSREKEKVAISSLLSFQYPRNKHVSYKSCRRNVMT